MNKFKIFVYTPAGHDTAGLAIAASRAGGVGILNAELSTDPDRLLKELDILSQKATGQYGIKIDASEDRILKATAEYARKGMGWVVIDGELVPECKDWISKFRQMGTSVLAELKTASWPDHPLDDLIDGLVIKGHESGGFVGESSSFVLLQKWMGQTKLPLLLRGGITPHVAAACNAVGVAGGVLDNQVLLLSESPLAKTLTPVLDRLSGSETIAVGKDDEGEFFRVLVRPGFRRAQEFCADGQGKTFPALKSLVQHKINWDDPTDGLLPLGQDVCFANSWRKQYGHMSAVFRAIDTAVTHSLQQAVESKSLTANSPLAKDLGTALPIVQGPMTRVSDNPEFALAVSNGGGLPTIALGLMKGEALVRIFEQTTQALNGAIWGVGLLGFAPQSLLDEQIAAAKKYKPGFAVIAGGRPDQAVRLDEAGIHSYLHVPSANLIPLFLQEGARRFILEGRECGGHVGPLCSFVLWSSVVDRLLAELESGNYAGEDIHVLFAGGLHDAVSSAMVQVLAAPLDMKKVKIGILMGSSYLFTKEIVDSGALVPTFQAKAIECERTVCLQSGPGHASRCAHTPFAETFFTEKQTLNEKRMSVEEIREALDNLILGRLRLATRGHARTAESRELKAFDEDYQQREGMYMVGQVASLRKEMTDIPSLHREVTENALKLLNIRANRVDSNKESPEHKPVDIAIIGIAAYLPQAESTQDYWDNILNKVVAITEIPPHRWDWRLYYDKDKLAKDKIYSKWGGFLSDMAFDPMQYGIPPKSIESVDPMQLMALEIARQTLNDAGYEHRDFDRLHTSVIIGASGGVGDVGLQYGLRTELPRFQGHLPDSVASLLPEWSEDTFAGILPNVIAGRISNRLNLGGVNFTTDAACASSLAAIYQGVSELISKRSHMVIAGGVDTVQGPFGYMCFSKTQALSPKGRCKTFNSTADGIVISEGIAMVAMKRLEDAERDGDRIYAVIKGIGGSSDGRARGLTAPEPAGQIRAMRRAYDMAGFEPDTVEFFEAHGTGTVAGDTAEITSTTQLLVDSGARPHQAAVSSVKTLIGHTKATAGVAGIIKTALALHHRVIPPHFPVEQPIEVLQRPDSPLYLTNKALPWIATKNIPRRAAVSSFGFGGTNFHVVLEEYTGEYRPWLHPVASRRWPAELLLFSGDDRKNLSENLTLLNRELEAHTDTPLRDLAYNLSMKWEREKETVAIVARDLTDLRNKIGLTINFLIGDKLIPPPGINYSAGATSNTKLAVLFPGQGSQYAHMFQELSVYFPDLSATLTEADNLLEDRFRQRFGDNYRLSRYIFRRGAYDENAQSSAAESLTRTDIAQPALGAVSAGMWRIMRSLGLEADMLGGHSYGEFVALFAAGYIDFETLMSLSEARGRFIVDAVADSGAELGTMAAVQATKEEVESIISDIDGVILANHNAPRQSIISGAKSAIQEAKRRFTEADIAAREIPVSAAFHSHFVSPAQTALADLINSTSWRSEGSEIPVYSNTTGRTHARDVDQIKQVMVQHLVKPIEFLSQINAMYRDGARVFLELGPKTVLTGLVGNILGNEHPHRAIAVDGNGGGIVGFLTAIAQLICAGVKINVVELFRGRSCGEEDPADLKQLRRESKGNKHVWMLNGSGVRRFDEPIRHIGVQKVSRPTHSPEAPATSSISKTDRQSPSPLSKPVKVRAMNKVYRKEGSHMRRRGQTPNNPDSSVIAEYFDTMRLFLETQERVISTYLGRSTPHRRSIPQMPRLGQASPLDPDAASVPDPTLRPPGPFEQPEYPKTDSDRTDASNRYTASEERQSEAKTSHAQPEKEHAQSSQQVEQVQGLDREKIADILLAIVEDKTGYPKDIVELDQNLEADLGIDSIKRVEIVGALMKLLPQNISHSIDGDRGQLNTQKTLGGMVDILMKVASENREISPFKKAGVGPTTHQPRRPLRHVLVAKHEPIDESVSNRLVKGHFILTQDKLGVAQALAERLRERDCSIQIIERDALRDEKSLNQWCEELKAEVKTVSGIVHLAPLGSPKIQADSPPGLWRQQLQLNEKSFFILLGNLSRMLDPESHVLAASALGGFFNRRSAKDPGLSLQGGAVGLIKSLYQERPGLRLKAVDVDPKQSAPAIAMVLLRELEVVGGRQEVGYPDGTRFVFQTAPAPLDEKGGQPEDTENLVLLATGGAKGVTAEVLREFARPGNTLLLSGRSPLSGSEPEHLRPFSDAEALRQYFVSEVREGRLKMSPAKIRKEVDSVLSAREMHLNIEDFRNCGATVEYFAVDVTDGEAMQKLFDQIYSQYGKIDGVIHGAGVIEDKLLADKSSESWSRVVETKVMGLLTLQKYLRPGSLKFFTVFSSVAGRYGNSGQTDYATANELMNRLCCQLSDQWGDQVIVKALCWGPWGPTKFGSGMVTEFTEAKFEEKGVKLVSAEDGRHLFSSELFQNDGQVEIICGEGPWEQQEAEIGRMEKKTRSVPAGLVGPLLCNAILSGKTDGDQVISILLGDTHSYLKDHRIDDIPVLPAAVALEIMAEATAQLWPEWSVVEARECRQLKGIELTAPDRKFNIVVNPPVYGSSEGFEVTVAIQSDRSDGKKRFHYRAVIRMEPQHPAPFPLKRKIFKGTAMPVTTAYDDWLFHGPKFQVIAEINGMSDEGVNASVKTTCPAQWLESETAKRDQWQFDPALVDSAAQMAIIWSRAFRNETPLPVKFGRVVRYAGKLPGTLHMQFERLPEEDPHTVRANIFFTGKDNQLFLSIEDMECVSSAALNRLGGTAETYPSKNASRLTSKEA